MRAIILNIVKQWRIVKKSLVLGLLIGAIPFFIFAKTPNDKRYFEQWYLEQIDAPEAWDTQTGSHAIVVAVLDAGVDLDHPDLVANIWTNSGEIAGNGKDDDQNGYIDDIHGWDLVNNDNDPSPNVSVGVSQDALTHGSLIAGLIGAKGNNRFGVAGVNWSIQIMPIRMLNNEGSGDSKGASKAILYAMGNGADVINMSFSGNTDDPVLRSAIKQAYENGVVIVSAIGNEGKDTDTAPVYPACYSSGDSDWVIGVASVGVADERSTFSNYGKECVDISAPGEDIFGVHYYNPEEGHGDAYLGGWSGTSMATPLVAGAVGILLAEYPSLTPEQVRNALKLSVDPLFLGSTYNGRFGAGRLNIAQALTIAGNFVQESTSFDDQTDGSSTGSTQETEFASGTFIKSSASSAVYYIDEETRRVVLDANTYFTYEDLFAVIYEVSDQVLASYPLRGLLLPKAGVVLVKIQSDSRVYALAQNADDEFSPFLRLIPDEQTAITLYGSDWADYVIDIEPTFFAKFSQGDIMASSESVNTTIMKKRVNLTESSFLAF